MTKREIAERVADALASGDVEGDGMLHISQKSALRVVNAVFDCIKDELAAGRPVELRNFGLFDVRVRKAKVGRNLGRCFETVHIPARSVVRFRPGKEMKQRVLKLSPQ